MPRTEITEVLAERVGGTRIASGDVFLPSIAALDLEMIRLRHRLGERKSPEGQRWECMATKVFWRFLTVETLLSPLARLDWTHRT